MSVSASKMLFCVLGAALYCLGGCGKTSDTPQVVPVNGTVTLDGKALADATVRFIPVDPKANGGAGKTDAEGKYSIAHATNLGVVPGSYKVVIEQYKSRDGKTYKIEEGMDIEQLKMQNLVQQALLPRYSDFSKTELTAEVSAGQPNVIGFDLKGT